MSTVDTLPADQRAVLSLVLARGRSYDQIATTLSIDRTAVRNRAIAALATLGPPEELSPVERAELTDYLLGQLPHQAGERTKLRLAGTPEQLRWARAVAVELAALSATPLSLIPRQAEKPSSRPGGALLLALVAAIAIVAIAIVLIRRNDSSSTTTPPQTTTSTTTPTTVSTSVSSAPAGTATAGSVTSPASAGAAASSTAAANATTTTSSGTASIIAQVNLLSPNRTDAGAAGVAQIVRLGSKTAMVLVAQGLPPNPPNQFYAVWLSKTPDDSTLLGFFQSKVKKGSKLDGDAMLSSNAAHYSKLLVTLESAPKPTAPGKVMLQGAFKLPA